MSITHHSTMRNIETNSQFWQRECVKLAQAHEVFLVDSFQESNLIFLKNLCAYFNYRMFSTSSMVYLEPNNSVVRPVEFPPMSF